MRLIVTILTALAIPALAHSQTMEAHHEAAAGIQYSTVTVPAPVAWWRIDASDTDASIADATGNGYTMQQGSAALQPTVDSGYAVFDGSDMMSISSTSLLNGQDNISISIWLWITAGVDYAGLLMFDAATDYGLITWGGTDDDRKKVRYWAGVADQYGPLPTGAWHHVVGTRRRNSATGHKLYVDGNLVLTDSSPNSAIGVANPWYMGQWPGLPARGLNGRLDDCRVWDVELSESQVKALYDGGRK